MSSYLCFEWHSSLFSSSIIILFTTILFSVTSIHTRPILNTILSCLCFQYVLLNIVVISTTDCVNTYSLLTIIFLVQASVHLSLAYTGWIGHLAFFPCICPTWAFSHFPRHRTGKHRSTWKKLRYNVFNVFFFSKVLINTVVRIEHVCCCCQKADNYVEKMERYKLFTVYLYRTGKYLKRYVFYTMADRKLATILKDSSFSLLVTDEHLKIDTLSSVASRDLANNTKKYTLFLTPIW